MTIILHLSFCFSILLNRIFFSELFSILFSINASKSAWVIRNAKIKEKALGWIAPQKVAIRKKIALFYACLDSPEKKKFGFLLRRSRRERFYFRERFGKRRGGLLIFFLHICLFLFLSFFLFSSFCNMFCM